MGVELIKAVMAFQADCPPIKFDSKNPHFKSKFASLGAIHAVINPILAKHGLAVMQFAIGGDGEAGCRTVIAHESGETMEDSFTVSVKPQDPQKACSAITYARRYGISSALNLITEEDDDGNGASGNGGAVSNAGSPPKAGTGAKSAAKSLSKPNAAKLKKAGEDRAQIIGDPGTPWLKIVTDCAKSFGYSSHIELLESDFDRMLSAIQQFGPDAPPEDDIPF